MAFHCYFDFVIHFVIQHRLRYLSNGPALWGFISLTINFFKVMETVKNSREIKGKANLVQVCVLITEPSLVVTNNLLAHQS